MYGPHAFGLKLNSSRVKLCEAVRDKLCEARGSTTFVRILFSSPREYLVLVNDFYNSGS
ncbi:hypothetical protein DVH05_010620, partial [Phytophthora capsici]